MLLQKIKSDLQKIFTEHGTIAFLIRESNPVYNKLGEVISYTPNNVEQIIIERRAEHKLLGSARGWTYQALAEMAGDISTGEIKFLLPADTQIQETSLIEYQGRRYHIETINPRRAFGEIVCYLAEAERADGNVQSE
ncbi:hypothetical protein [Aneurinibacillus thermoaerophilus]|uniref:hypothetical protein n=1 Tax=Aneurinibacillus thermoaerophilus TaxID=143495 RepID=UPI001C312BCB|nr:hypothetical protein [Aneurinibacillus thermoaerophilus]